MGHEGVNGVYLFDLRLATPPGISRHAHPEGDACTTFVLLVFFSGVLVFLHCSDWSRSRYHGLDYASQVIRLD